LRVDIFALTIVRQVLIASWRISSSLLTPTRLPFYHIIHVQQSIQVCFLKRDARVNTGFFRNYCSSSHVRTHSHSVDQAIWASRSAHWQAQSGRSRRLLLCHMLALLLLQTSPYVYFVSGGLDSEWIKQLSPRRRGPSSNNIEVHHRKNATRSYRTCTQVFDFCCSHFHYCFTGSNYADVIL
jgi:hypothetical protein